MAVPLELPVRSLWAPRHVNHWTRPTRREVVSFSIWNRWAWLDDPMSRVVLILLAT